MGTLGAAERREGRVRPCLHVRPVVGRDEDDKKLNIAIPAERVGFVFVFRTFEFISYALVVQADGPVEANDFVRTP